MHRHGLSDWPQPLHSFRHANRLSARPGRLRREYGSSAIVFGVAIQILPKPSSSGALPVLRAQTAAVVKLCLQPMYSVCTSPVPACPKLPAFTYEYEEPTVGVHRNTSFFLAHFGCFLHASSKIMAVGILIACNGLTFSFLTSCIEVLWKLYHSLIIVKTRRRVYVVDMVSLLRMMSVPPGTHLSPRSNKSCCDKMLKRCI